MEDDDGAKDEKAERKMKREKSDAFAFIIIRCCVDDYEYEHRAFSCIYSTQWMIESIG